MPTDEEWEKALRRLSRGESSYREEGEKLGVHHSIVGRRFIAWLNRETEKRQSIYTQLKQNLDSLEEEYAKKKQVEEEKFRRATVKAEGEHRKRMSELDVEFVAKRERLRKAAAKTEEEHKNRMAELDREIAAKKKLLAEFEAMNLKPTEGLQLLGKARNLKQMVASLDATAEEKAKELTEIEKDISITKRNAQSWKWHRAAVKEEAQRDEAKYRWLTQNIQYKQAEMDTISLYINDMKDERTELELKVDELRREHGELVDAIESLRVRHTQLSSDHERLQADHDRLLAEVKELERIEVEAVKKIARILEVEENRERDADIAFEKKCQTFAEELARIRREGETETEKQIREFAGDRLEKLQVSLERLEVARIELMVLGIQRSIMIDEIKKLEEKRRELEKMTSIPSLVAVGQ